MKWLAHRYLTLKGWSFEGELPDVPKMIVIGAPHTSNWDFILFLGALHHFRVRVQFIGKHTLFRWPFGWFFRALGGIPVDRSRPGGLVSQVADAMDATDQMILVMARETVPGRIRAGIRVAIPEMIRETIRGETPAVAQATIPGTTESGIPDPGMAPVASPAFRPDRMRASAACPTARAR